MQQYVYQKNIENIQNFLHALDPKFYEELDTLTLKHLINVIYVDPDLCDKYLLEKAKHFSKKHNQIIFSPDGICGWRILFDIYGKEEWLDKYAIIRGSSLGELFWPSKIIEKKQTINRQRSIIFGDRIDLTLHDIKNYLENGSCKMDYTNPDTKKFFEPYKKPNGFSEFIDDFFLHPFIMKVNNRLEVIDLNNTADTPQPLLNPPEFSWSNRFSPQKKSEMLKIYLDNLLMICSSYKKEYS